MLSHVHHRAFERLYREHQPGLLREAVRLSGNEADAWDLTQETFERAYRCFGSYQAGGHGFSWLRTIMTRLFIDGWRRQRAVTSIDTLELPAPGPDEPPLWSTFSDEELRQAVAELPAPKRQLLEQHVFFKQSYAALAARLHIRLPTIGSRLHRIRGGLKAALLMRQRVRASRAPTKRPDGRPVR